MKKITLVLLFSTFSLFAQNSSANCDILLKINKLLQQEHYSPKPVNDSLSAYIFDELLNNLDPSRNIARFRAILNSTGERRGTPVIPTTLFFC